MTDRTPLSKQMHALADKGDFRAVELREKADALDAAADGKDMRKMLGAWARARRLWCDVTGESLV